MNIGEILLNLWNKSGFAAMNWQNAVLSLSSEERIPHSLYPPPAACLKKQPAVTFFRTPNAQLAYTVTAGNPYLFHKI